MKVSGSEAEPMLSSPLLPCMVTSTMFKHVPSGIGHHGHRSLSFVFSPQKLNQ